MGGGTILGKDILLIVAIAIGVNIVFVVLLFEVIHKHLRIKWIYLKRQKEIEWLSQYVKDTEKEVEKSKQIDNRIFFNMSLRYMSLLENWANTAFDKHKIFISANTVNKRAYHCLFCYYTSEGPEFVLTSPINTTRTSPIKGLSKEIAELFIGKLIFVKSKYGKNNKYFKEYNIYLTNCDVNGTSHGNSPKIVGIYEFNEDINTGQYLEI